MLDPGRSLPILAIRSDLHAEIRQEAERGAAQHIAGTAPLRSVTVQGVDIIGTFRAADREKPSVLLTAHYDGVGDDPDGTRFPAACDNASGVASVMEAVRLLHELLPVRVGLQVALLDAEETGAQGSAVHAGTVSPESQVINLDGAASLSTAHVEAGGNAERLLLSLDSAARMVGVPLTSRAMPSDNRRYAAAGLAALGIGMGMPGYQTPLETVDQVQVPTLVAATRLLVHTTLLLVS